MPGRLSKYKREGVRDRNDTGCQWVTHRHMMSQPTLDYVYSLHLYRYPLDMARTAQMEFVLDRCCVMYREPDMAAMTLVSMVCGCAINKQEVAVGAASGEFENRI